MTPTMKVLGALAVLFCSVKGSPIVCLLMALRCRGLSNYRTSTDDTPGH